MNGIAALTEVTFLELDFIFSVSLIFSLINAMYAQPCKSMCKMSVKSIMHGENV